MYIIKLYNGLYYTGSSAGSSNRNLAVIFSSEESAEEYASGIGTVMKK